TAHPYRSEDGCPGCQPGHAWLDWLMEQQLRVRQWGTDVKVVYLGVDLVPRVGIAQAFAQISRRAAEAELAGLQAQADQVTAVVAGAGLGGVPANPRQMQGLMHRSCFLHLPAPLPVQEQPAPAPYALPATAPPELDSDALGAFTDSVRWTA